MQPRILAKNLAPGSLTLDAEASHHLCVVLRCQPGERITVFDGAGREAQARITRATKSEVEIDIAEIITVNRESPHRVTVIQALCTGDKMDWVIQKSTELGAARIIPLAAARSVLKLDATRANKRIEHWSAIAQSAAAQCGRTVVPEVTPLMSLADAISDWASQPSPKTGWLLDPFADQRIGGTRIEGDITILIGPEAGWTDDEERAAKAAGIKGIQVGPRILRTETAAAVVLAAIAMKSGEF